MGMDTFHLLLQLLDLRAHQYAASEEVPAFTMDVRAHWHVGSLRLLRCCSAELQRDDGCTLCHWFG